MMTRLLLSCQMATELMEKKHQRKLSFSERVQLFMHTAMCDACRQYEKQSAVLERLLKAREKASIEPEMDIQTVELQEKIIKRLNKGGSQQKTDG